MFFTQKQQSRKNNNKLVSKITLLQNQISQLESQNASLIQIYQPLNELYSLLIKHKDKKADFFHKYCAYASMMADLCLKISVATKDKLRAKLRLLDAIKCSQEVISALNHDWVLTLQIKDLRYLYLSKLNQTRNQYNELILSSNRDKELLLPKLFKQLNNLTKEYNLTARKTKDFLSILLKNYCTLSIAYAEQGKTLYAWHFINKAFEIINEMESLTTAFNLQKIQGNEQCTVRFVCLSLIQSILDTLSKLIQTNSMKKIQNNLRLFESLRLQTINILPEMNITFLSLSSNSALSLFHNNYRSLALQLNRNINNRLLEFTEDEKRSNFSSYTALLRRSQIHSEMMDKITSNRKQYNNSKLHSLLKSHLTQLSSIIQNICENNGTFPTTDIQNIINDLNARVSFLAMLLEDFSSLIQLFLSQAVYAVNIRQYDYAIECIAKALDHAKSNQNKASIKEIISTCEKLINIINSYMTKLKDNKIYINDSNAKLEIQKTYALPIRRFQVFIQHAKDLLDKQNTLVKSKQPSNPPSQKNSKEKKQNPSSSAVKQTQPSCQTTTIDNNIEIDYENAIIHYNKTSKRDHKKMQTVRISFQTCINKMENSTIDNTLIRIKCMFHITDIYRLQAQQLKRNRKFNAAANHIHNAVTQIENAQTNLNEYLKISQDEEAMNQNELEELSETITIGKWTLDETKQEQQAIKHAIVRFQQSMQANKERLINAGRWPIQRSSGEISPDSQILHDLINNQTLEQINFLGSTLTAQEKSHQDIYDKQESLSDSLDTSMHYQITIQP